MYDPLTDNPLWYLIEKYPNKPWDWDGISRNPLVFGRYGVDTAEVIKTYRTNGYHNFLLNIGANIGLTSCLAGNGFD